MPLLTIGMSLRDAKKHADGQRISEKQKAMHPMLVECTRQVSTTS